MISVSGSGASAQVVRSGADGVPSTATSIVEGFNLDKNVGLDAVGSCLAEDEVYKGTLSKIYFSTEIDGPNSSPFIEGDLLVHDLGAAVPNSVVITNSQLVGYRSNYWGLDGIDLYPEKVEPIPTAEPTRIEPTITPTRQIVAVTPTPPIVMRPAEYEEVVISQGLGGDTLVNIRNFDPDEGPISAIIRSFNGARGTFRDAIGGGAGRAAYVSTGDLDQNGNPDVVVSFGPITAPAIFPNIIVVRDAVTRGVVGHSFQAFPTGSGSDVNYNGGEVRTAVGDFLGTGAPQIAVAQGYGGSGVVRLYEYTGLPAPFGWRVVGQFTALTTNAQQKNANGGLTLASGDLNGDGVDELLAGQTNSDTSQTLFCVLQINSSGGVAKRLMYAGFEPRFRGNGGVQPCVVDLNGDGINEIVVASMGNDRMHGDDRDNAPLNLIGVIQPVLSGSDIIGFSRAQSGVLNVLSSTINPSGAISIGAGELNGLADGQEMIFGTGSMVDVNGFNVTPILPAPDSRYRVAKLSYDGSQVTGLASLYGAKGSTFPAFTGVYDPTSGAVYVDTLNLP